MSCLYKRLLVTGGCGFIGHNFLDYLIYNIHYNGVIVNVDKMNYASQNVFYDYNKNYKFIKGDCCDYEFVKSLFDKYDFDCVIHFASESNVDYSIKDPISFMKNNIDCTTVLLDLCREKKVRFHLISTDEVYGALKDFDEKPFTEKSPYNPTSPYASSKASQEMIAMSYYKTYGVPVTISNCSNNYGEYQDDSKFIPRLIGCIKNKNEFPLYGTGGNARNWIYVKDHCEAIWKIVNEGRFGEKYNVGGKCCLTNMQVMMIISDLMETDVNFKHVEDRLSHDWKYDIDYSKITNELGWTPMYDFIDGLYEYLNIPKPIKY